jgi:cyclohexadieny/prephenate dehydrogenase
MASPQFFRRICLVGLGLIGSSIARAVRAYGVQADLIGYDASAQVRAQALDLGLVDAMAPSLEEAVCGADLVILCTPVGTYSALGAAMAAHLMPGALVSDVGSVKGSVINQLLPVLPANVHFIPAHPVAGTEKSGPAAGFAQLFCNRWCILTPLEGVDPAMLARLEGFWSQIGAHVECMDAKHHDLVLAVTSHVPHLIAYTIVGTASDLEGVTNSEVIKYSAGGFRDFTRIAASDPTMWRDVFLTNKDAVLEILQRFSEDLTALQRAIRWDDGDTLHALFTRTRTIRRSIIEAGQDKL